MEPSLEETLELAGDTGGSKGVSTCEWTGDQNGNVSLAQISKVLDKTECYFGRTSSHHSYFSFFTSVLYVFIKLFEYWTL